MGKSDPFKYFITSHEITRLAVMVYPILDRLRIFCMIAVLISVMKPSGNGLQGFADDWLVLSLRSAMGSAQTGNGI